MYLTFISTISNARKLQTFESLSSLSQFSQPSPNLPLFLCLLFPWKVHSTMKTWPKLVCLVFGAFGTHGGLIRIVGHQTGLQPSDH